MLLERGPIRDLIMRYVSYGYWNLISEYILIFIYLLCKSIYISEVGVDNRGEIQYMDAVFYVNDGHSQNENENAYSTSSLQNCYDSRRWKVDSFGTITDAPCNAFMRAPGK